jgi:hypothetical protein
MTFADADAVDNPLVGSLDDLLKIEIGENFRGDIGAEGTDFRATRHAAN